MRWAASSVIHTGHVARRPDPIRILQAQIAGTTQRLADLDLLVPRGLADEHQRAAAQERLDELHSTLDALTADQQHN